MRTLSPSFRLLSAVALLLLGTSARAAEWEWAVTPYLWASDMSVDVKVNGDEVIGGDVDFSDILDNLEMAFQIHLEGRRGQFGFFTDFTYLSVSDSNTLPERPPLPGGTEVQVDIETILFELAGTYQPNENFPLQLFVGVRSIGMDVELDVSIPAPIDEELSTDGSRDMIDVFGGARMLAPLGENFFVVLRGDLGTGDSDLTWNVQTALGLKLGARDQFGAILGYRHMEIEFKEDSVKTEMTMTGPMAGFMFRF